MDNHLSPPAPTIIEQEPETMDFYEAIKAVAKGNQILRLSWPDNDYGLLVDGILTIRIKGEFKHWIINDGDLEGVDWIIRETN